MSSPNNYEQHIANVENREKQLRAEIDEVSTKLEKKVRTGLVIGFASALLATVFFIFVKKPRKQAVKKEKVSRKNWVLQWLIKYIVTELTKQIWKVVSVKLKDS